MSWYVTSCEYREVMYPQELIRHRLATCHSILVDAIEDWLFNWNREFGYFDRQASKMRAL